jgi:aminopeptidase N
MQSLKAPEGTIQLLARSELALLDGSTSKMWLDELAQRVLRHARLGFWLWLLLFLFGAMCAISRGMGDATAHIFGDPETWRWAPTRSYHVENYKLGLHFDQDQGEVFGDEVVMLRPVEPHFRNFYLNSSELQIDSVVLDHLQGEAIRLAYDVRDSRLWITLDREYDKDHILNVRITYHGFPRTGLFFVNPTPNYPNWPHEIFSQGEPELNQYWFPCWDYPNEMSTSETITTVPEGQVVVSNGKLVKVLHHAGQVTYDWLESVPHSSYLISIAIGPWRKVSDRYEDKPVDYYVPNNVDDVTARRSFHLTPDMMDFFSRATGVDYPYEQYAQTTVQNFIFGGQENVSATTLTDSTLHDGRADQDYPSTNLVSHELGQHWFGDFVQGRDWANMWLNEGFATYMEALYTQHQEGTDAYRFAIYQDQLLEQREDHERYRRPLVDRHFNDPLDMFDSTTHEKGAAVLDMLRYIIDGGAATAHPASQGEPLFQALHQYLIANQKEVVETSDLIRAIRNNTGQELDWFFREWVFMAGHPEYRVETSYDTTDKIENVTVTQTQMLDSKTPIFDMPVDLAFFGENGERKRVQVRNNLRQQQFEIPLEFEPQWVDFDPDDFIDKTVQFDKPLDALIAQAEKDPSMMSRLWAVQQLAGISSTDSDKRVDALIRVLAHDSFYGVRSAAATGLGSFKIESAKTALLSALRQSDSRVRAAVITALGQFSNDNLVFNALVYALHNDSSYAVEAAAAQEVGKSKLAQAYDVLKAEAAAKPEVHVMQATLNGLAATKDPRAVEVLLRHAQPGVSERIRVSALAGLGSLRDQVTDEPKPELIKTVRAALIDAFFPVQEMGEELVGIYHLTQFEADIQAQAQKAPMAMQRRAAQRVLEQLHPRR